MFNLYRVGDTNSVVCNKGDDVVVFKCKKKPFAFFLLLVFSIPNIVFAYSDYLIPGGENIGIELKSKGVIVVGSYAVNHETPAKEAGLLPGDIITTIDNQKVSSIQDLVNIINQTTQNSVKITYLRNDQEKFTNLKLYKENGTIKTGLYVKDSIIGIGTMSFIDPNTKIFGALGHEIIEKSSGRIFEIQSGSIFESTVTGITKSSDGTPGEKNARYYTDRVNGTVSENTNKGIFGKYTTTLPDEKLYKVATSKDVEVGPALIRTVLSDNTIKEYSIRILKVNDSTKTKNILFEITDEELLQTSGGIVQGMSGSPILQGDYIVGAVTHVVVDNPHRGYGILVTNMLEEAEN